MWIYSTTERKLYKKNCERKMHVIVNCIVLIKPKKEKFIRRQVKYPHNVNNWPIVRVFLPMMKQKMAINLWIYRYNIKLFADLIVILLIIDLSVVVGHSNNEHHHHHHNNHVCNHQHPKSHEVSCLILTLLIPSLSFKLISLQSWNFIMAIDCNHVW